MKQKTNISITIDSEIYLKAKLKENFNISGECNDFLKQRLGETQTSKDLEKEISAKESELRYLEYEKNKIEVARRREEEAWQKKKQEEQELELANIPIGNDFQAKLTREKLFKEKPELKKKWEEK